MNTNHKSSSNNNGGTRKGRRVRFALEDSTTAAAAAAAPDGRNRNRIVQEEEDNVINPENTATAKEPQDNTTTTTTKKQEQGPIWFLEEEQWELTWPIWHMLPRTERKALAQKHGYKTIGEFEEYMTLQRAVGLTTTTTTTASQQQPYDNDLIYNNSASSDEKSKEDAKKVRAAGSSTSGAKEEEDDDGVDDNSITNEKDLDQKLEESEQKQASAADDNNKLSREELVKLGGKILLLPDEMLHRVFDWLPVDTYATLALVSPHWKSFTRTETVYKRLCERLYLNQSKRRTLHVSRFNNSYRTMLERRPRVRAGGGLYIMKYSWIKPIQRDMWTEVPVGAILETTYYRYLYFQEDGRVLYALTSSPPHEMLRRFVKVCLMSTTRQREEEQHEKDRVVVWGTYQVKKNKVTVTAKQEWQHVKLELSIILGNNIHGRFGLLSFDGHMTSAKGNFEDCSPDRVVYQVPGEPFRFVKDKRL